MKRSKILTVYVTNEVNDEIFRAGILRTYSEAATAGSSPRLGGTFL